MPWTEWISQNPAEAAWIAFGILTVIIAAYQRFEPRFKALAAASKTKIDDKLVYGAGVVLAWLGVLLDFAKLVVPRGASSLIRPVAPPARPSKAPKGKKGKKDA